MMGGIVESIFGGGEEKPETRIESRPTISPAQQKVQTQLGDVILNRLMGEIAPLGIENISLQALEQLALNAVSGEPTVNMISQKALQDIMTRGPQDIDEYFRTVIQEPALRDFNRDVIPAIQERFAPQFFGGERRESEARATEELLRLLTQERTRVGFEARQADTEAILAAAGLAPAASLADTSLLTALLGAGTGFRESLAGERSRRIQEGLAFQGTPTQENIAITTPGRAGSPGIFGDIASFAAKAAIGSQLGVF